MTGRIMGRDPLALADFAAFCHDRSSGGDLVVFLWRTLPAGSGANLVRRRKDIAAVED